MPRENVQKKRKESVKILERKSGGVQEDLLAGPSVAWQEFLNHGGTRQFKMISYC